MLDATLRVRGCREYVGDDGWVVGQKILPSPKREKRFKNAVIIKFTFPRCLCSLVWPQDQILVKEVEVQV